ncbi:putative membrane protein [Staphylococcus auricularis]|uniref:Uncharacterized protein n=1 Tax=Staphylococcus auricularis TaxID=29379 RepID=A0AAP8PME3_9STAP|nr:hypothetical protein [Staphylococcus auricularis]MBM0867171.1 hypothetical protein [Staphylococcus auricularis]PNZ66033.1 hypothetical protein CD158_09815 [Staphylococcus auricularis]BCU51487.1 hypothetical protein JCM2421_02590 [Staphylococcus auricularis]SQJ06589.1 Uncharacterised protein [Staphylococcus auricularis]
MIRSKNNNYILLSTFGIVLACLTLPFVIGLFSLFFIFPPLLLLFLNMFVLKDNQSNKKGDLK